jgi:hypothetical protein
MAVIRSSGFHRSSSSLGARRSPACDDCVQNYGMQVGQKLRLRKLAPSGETEVRSVAVTEGGVWVRYSDGWAGRVGWDEFEKVTT